ncbi:MAG: ABC transporter permease [Tannerellaceae bacterium]|nr:ABC transporter permease [Tannerellaceae bacterium]
MYKLYFIQAFRMLKQDRFRSVVTILGTALAIMMVMVILVADEIRCIAVAPEINRDRTYYIGGAAERDTSIQSMWGGYLTPDIIQRGISEGFTVPEQFSYVGYLQDIFAGTEGNKELHPARLCATDAAYWKIFAFNFIAGTPFSQETFESGMHEAVISEKIARTIFRDENAIGQTIMLNFIPYRVTGVVKDVSPLFSSAYSDIWVSYKTPLKGEGYRCVLLLKNKKDYPLLAQEVRGLEKKYGSENINKTLYLQGPVNHRTMVMGVYGDSQEMVEGMIKLMKGGKILTLFILLLIPAINLSGLTLSHIKRRMAEIGVRKAFGARKKVILTQVLWENMLTACIGGVIGLILSYPVIFWLKEWLLQLPEGQSIPFNTLFSLPVALLTVVVCILLNLLSSGIPAYRASKLTIIQSLTKNNR